MFLFKLLFIFEYLNFYLEDSFGEGSLLRELLQVLGVRVVIGGEIRLEHAQLVMLERCP